MINSYNALAVVDCRLLYNDSFSLVFHGIPQVGDLGTFRGTPLCARKKLLFGSYLIMLAAILSKWISLWILFAWLRYIGCTRYLGVDGLGKIRYELFTIGIVRYFGNKTATTMS